MSQEEEEYEVELIRRARLVKLNKKRTWQYDVKWKGYDVTENTWEPASSFQGSGHFIEAFWARVNDKRDYHNLKLFNEGEVIFPAGPPRGTKSQGKTKAISKASASSAGSKPPRKSRDEVVEDSEPEVEPVTDKQQSSRANKKRSASVIDVDMEEVAPSKRRRGRPAKSGNSRENGPESASTGPRLSKKSSVPKLPRIPAVKTKPKSVAPQSAPIDNSAGKVSAPKPTSKTASKIVLKEPLPDTAHLGTKTAVDGSSSEADQACVVETLDNHSKSSNTGSPVGDEDMHMAEAISMENQPVAGPSFSTASASVSATKVPAHRAREANPRIKLMDNSFTAHSGLSVKAALSLPSTSFAGPSNGVGKRRHHSSVFRPKAREDPSNHTTIGSSSPLTTGKDGVLITVQKHVPTVLASTEQDDTDVTGSIPPVIPAGSVDTILAETADHSVPAAEEVLRLAGMEPATANALPDYEDTSEQDAEGESDHGHDYDLLGLPDPVTLEYSEDSFLPADMMMAPLPSEQEQSSQISVAVGLEMAEPSRTQVSIAINPQPMANSPTALIGTAAIPGNSSFMAVSTSATWRQTTIFGPLSGSARSLPATPLEGPPIVQEDVGSSKLLVVLGPTIDLPVVLKDVHPAKTPSLKSLESIVGNVARGVPGKFYRGENATGLVSAFKTDGSCARIVLDGGATESQKQHFERFKTLLNGGAIFVAMVGTHLLAFSSSENVELSTRLGMSPNLVGLGENILVAEVVIENDSLYFDAMINAENERW